MILIERWLLHRGLMLGWGILILLFQHPQISQKFPYIPTCARCKLDFDNRATLISWRTKSATRMMITSSQEWYLSSQEIRLVLILESYFHLLMPGDSEMQGNPSSHTYPRQMQIFPPQCQQLVHRRINLNPSRKLIAQDTHGQKFHHTHTHTHRECHWKVIQNSATNSPLKKNVLIGSALWTDLWMPLNSM